MIQFNLLPDIKLEFIKARRAKRLVMIICFIAVAISLGLLVIMFSFNAFQKNHLSSLSDDIKKADQKLQSIPDLARILTIQNQLNSLPDLYAQRPAASRLFGYLQQTTPTKISINHLKIGLEDGLIDIDGTSDSLESVNQYVDTLKFTKYTIGEDKVETNAFSEVVLSSFSVTDQKTTFKVTFKSDSVIFDGSQDVKLVVPKTISTRSATELPTSVFEAEEN